jgi:hypothetical protein
MCITLDLHTICLTGGHVLAGLFAVLNCKCPEFRTASEAGMYPAVGSTESKAGQACWTAAVKGLFAAVAVSKTIVASGPAAS